MASSPQAEATFISGVGTDNKVAASSFQAWNSDNRATYNATDTATGKWATTNNPVAGSPGGTITYYFDAASGWTDTQKSMFRAAFALWSAEANIAFVENTGTGDPNTQIKIQNTSAGAFGGPQLSGSASAAPIFGAPEAARSTLRSRPSVHWMAASAPGAAMSGRRSSTRSGMSWGWAMPVPMTAVSSPPPSS